MSFKHLAIDLETLGTRPGSVITQIGLTGFDEFSMMTVPVYVDPQSCLDIGMTMDWPTVRWWLVQDERPRRQMAEAAGCNIVSAVYRVQSFINEHITLDFEVWGYGANFDITLLESAFRLCHAAVPWHYRQVRCARTLLAATPGAEKPMSSAEHQAADDSAATAKLVRRCLFR